MSIQLSVKFLIKNSDNDKVVQVSIEDAFTDLQQVRKKLENANDFPPLPTGKHGKPGSNFYFTQHNNGTEVAPHDEHLIVVGKVWDGSTKTVYMTENPDIQGTRVDWQRQSGLSFQAVLRQPDKNKELNEKAAAINKDRTPPIMLTNVKMPVETMQPFTDVVVCDAGSAVQFNYAYTGILGYSCYAFTGADTLTNWSCCWPTMTPNTEYHGSSSTFPAKDNIVDLIIVKSSVENGISIGNTEIAKHWQLTVQVWGLKGWELTDKNNQNPVYGGTLAPAGASMSDAIDESMSAAAVQMSSAADSSLVPTGKVMNIHGRDVDPGLIVHGPGAAWESSGYIVASDPTFDQGRAFPNVTMFVNFLVFKDHETALKYVGIAKDPFG